MNLFRSHHHEWSKWRKTKWTTVNYVLYAPYPIEHKGIIRYCLACLEEDVRDGVLWQDILDGGELSERMHQ